MAVSYNELTVAELKEMLLKRKVEKPLPTKKAHLIRKLHDLDLTAAALEDDDDKEDSDQEDVALDVEEKLLSEGQGDEKGDKAHAKMDEGGGDTTQENGQEEKMEEEEEEQEDPKITAKRRRRAVPFDLVKTKIDRIRDIRYKSLLAYPISFDDLTSYWLQQALSKAQQFFVRFFEHENTKCAKGSIELRMKTREEADEMSTSLSKKKEGLIVKLLDPNSTIDQSLQEMRGVTENPGTSQAKRMLVVEDLPYYVKDESIKEAFPEASGILRPRHNDGHYKRYCYVEYATEEKCQEKDKEFFEKDLKIEDEEVFVRPVWQELTEDDVEGLLDMSEKEEMRVRIHSLRGDRKDALAEDKDDLAYRLGKAITKLQAQLNKDRQIRIKMAREETRCKEAEEAAKEEKTKQPTSILKRPRQTSVGSTDQAKYARTSVTTPTRKPGGYSGARGSFNQGSYNRGGGMSGGYMNKNQGVPYRGPTPGYAGRGGMMNRGGARFGGGQNTGFIQPPSNDRAVVKDLLQGMQNIMEPGQRQQQQQQLQQLQQAQGMVGYPQRPNRGAMMQQGYGEDPYNVESGYAQRRQNFGGRGGFSRY